MLLPWISILVNKISSVRIFQLNNFHISIYENILTAKKVNTVFLILYYLFTVNALNYVANCSFSS